MRAHWPFLVAAALCWAPRSARAIPGIDGHMTDPERLLGPSDKSAIEDRLGNIQQETHIDVAGWLTRAPDDELDALGRQAYAQWNIGKQWDNAVFFMIPPGRRAHLVLDLFRPELSALEQERILAADDPRANLRNRIERLADATANILRPKVLHPRPPGAKDPLRALAYGIPAMLLVALAAVMSQRRARSSSP